MPFSLNDAAEAQFVRRLFRLEHFETPSILRCSRPFPCRIDFCANGSFTLSQSSRRILIARARLYPRSHHRRAYALLNCHWLVDHLFQSFDTFSCTTYTPVPCRKTSPLSPSINMPSKRTLPKQRNPLLEEEHTPSCKKPSGASGATSRVGMRAS